MNKTIIFVIIIVLAVSSVLIGTGCKAISTAETSAETTTAAAETTAAETTAAETTAAETTAAAQYNIGVSFLDLKNTLYIQSGAGFKSVWPEGSKVTIQDCNNSADKQAEQIDNYAAAGVQGIFMLAVERVAISAAVDEARAKGVKVVTWVTELENYDGFIKTPAYEYGKLLGDEAGKWIRDKLGGKAKVGILSYDLIPDVIVRKQGMIDGIMQYAPDAEIIGDQLAAAPDQGLPIAEQWLSAHPDMKVIIGINDGGAIGAYNAVMAADPKIQENFFIGGCDGIQEALDLINEPDSIYRCSVWTNIYEHGAQGARMLKDAIDGKPFDKIWLAPILIVNKDNISEYIDLAASQK